MAAYSGKSKKTPLPPDVIMGSIMLRRRPSRPEHRSLFEDNIYGKLFWDKIEWRAAQAEGAYYFFRATWPIWVILAVLYYFSN